MKQKLLISLFAMLTATTAWARVGNEFTVDGMIYKVTKENPNEVQICGPEGSSSTITGALVIPVSVSDGGTVYAVTQIGKEAFSCCYDLTSVTIPEGIREIGKSAFYVCTNLKSVTLPESLLTIGNEAFMDCWVLSSITIPSNVTTIGKEAFMECYALTSIHFPASVESIGASAFETADGLASITFAEGSRIRSIGRNAFRDTQWINNQPEGLVYLDKALLGYNGYIEDETEESLIVADGTVLIADYALCGTWWTTSIIVPASVKYIGNNAFEYCELTSFTIPDGVESIGDYAFAECLGIKFINIPESVTSIGQNVFYQSDLTTVTIPASVVSLGYSVFQETQSLTSVTFARGSQLKEIPAMAFYDCPALKYVNIPSSVTTIGDYAFGGCTSLTSITIPYGVTAIVYSFPDCTSLSDVYCYADPAVLNWWYRGDYMENNATRWHVADAEAWKRRFPYANVTFVGDLNPIMFAITEETAENPANTAEPGRAVTSESGVTTSLAPEDKVDQEEGSVTITSSMTTDEVTSLIETAEPGTLAFSEGFSGFYFMLAAGKGKVEFDIETQGNYSLGVMKGTSVVGFYTQATKGTVTIPYDIDEDTWFFAYPAVSAPTSTRTYHAPAAGDEGALKVYSLRIVPEEIYDPNGLKEIESDKVTRENTLYNLAGQRMARPTKGLYIQGGRKVVIR